MLLTTETNGRPSGPSRPGSATIRIRRGTVTRTTVTADVREGPVCAPAILVLEGLDRAKRIAIAAAACRTTTDR